MIELLANDSSTPTAHGGDSSGVGDTCKKGVTVSEESKILADKVRYFHQQVRMHQGLYNSNTLKIPTMQCVKAYVNKVEKQNACTNEVCEVLYPSETKAMSKEYLPELDKCGLTEADLLDPANGKPVSPSGLTNGVVSDIVYYFGLPKTSFNKYMQFYACLVCIFQLPPNELDEKRVWVKATRCYGQYTVHRKSRNQAR